MFEFTKEEYEELVDKLMLNEELSKILEMKIKGCSIIEISMKLNLSESTVKRRINKLKKKILHKL
jgi:DNA-binding NarL/FixJ family response regulator